MADIRKAVFPVAGRGTRMLPATRAVPKEMLPLVDRPLIDYGVQEAIASGIDEMIFVIAPGKESLVDHFVSDDIRISVAVQTEQRGLGHAIWCARDEIAGEPFAVILPDDIIVSDTPCIAQLHAAWCRVGGNVAAVQEVDRRATASYGILDVAQDDGYLARCRGLVEKPEPENAPSTLSIVGRYILEPGVLDVLARGTVGAGDEVQLTDAIAERIASEPFHGCRFEGTRHDCGSKEGMLEATVALALARPDLAHRMRDIIRRYNAAEQDGETRSVGLGAAA